MPIRCDNGPLPLAFRNSSDVRDAWFGCEIQCIFGNSFTKAIDHDSLSSRVLEILNAKGQDQSDL